MHTLLQLHVDRMPASGVYTCARETETLSACVLLHASAVGRANRLVNSAQLETSTGLHSRLAPVMQSTEGIMPYFVSHRCQIRQLVMVTQLGLYQSMAGYAKYTLLSAVSGRTLQYLT